MSEFISKDDVSLDKLLAVFQAEGLQVERDDEMLVVRDEKNIRTYVSIQEEAWLITFSAWIGLSDQVLEKTKLKMVNELNAETFIAKFFLESSESLQCSAQMPYAAGVSADQLTYLLKMYTAVFQFAFINKIPEDMMVFDD